MINYTKKIEEIEKVVNGENCLLKDSVLDIVNGSGEVVISGNKQGLVLLALQILRLADNGTSGSHYHIDECSIADRADISVVVSLKGSD